MSEEFEEDIEERELYEHFKVVADSGQSLLRVDRFLCNHLGNISRSRIQEVADCGFLFANGIPVKSNYKVKPHDLITIEMEFPRKELVIIAQDIPLNILYEDEDLIVINKNPGMVVHPGFGNYSGTLVNALSFHLKDNPLFKNNDPRPGLVHRIDKDTSGILVIAKNETAKAELAKQFFYKTAKRKYIAVVWGIPPNKEGRVETYIGRNLKDRKMMSVFPDEQHGKWAATNYKIIEELGYVSVIECVLETGRTHQIRVHCKYLGYPVFNDSIYGGDKIVRGTTFTKYKQFVNNCFSVCPRQALHAKSLGFVHPTKKEFMFFDSDMPSDMSDLINKWKSYITGRELSE